MSERPNMGKEVNQSRHLYGWLLACINKDCNWGGKLQNESSKNKNSNNKKKNNKQTMKGRYQILEKMLGTTSNFF